MKNVKHESLIKEIEIKGIKSAIKRGLNIIVDDTNLTLKRVKHLASLTKNTDYEVDILFFKCDVEQAIKNDMFRMYRVGEKVINNMEELRIKNIELIKSEFNWFGRKC